MPTIDEIIFAKAGLWQLGILTALALTARVTHNRRVLLLGGCGSFLGYVIPQSPVYENHRSVEAATLAAINHSANHLAVWGIAGAVLATGLALLLKPQHPEVDVEPRGDKSWPRRLSVSTVLMLGVVCWALGESTSGRSTGPQQWHVVGGIETLLVMCPLLGSTPFGLVTTMISRRYTAAARIVAGILLGLFGVLLWLALSHLWTRAAFLFAH